MSAECSVLVGLPPADFPVRTTAGELRLDFSNALSPLISCSLPDIRGVTYELKTTISICSVVGGVGSDLSLLSAGFDLPLSRCYIFS